MLQGDAIREITLEGPAPAGSRPRRRRRRHGLGRRHVAQLLNDPVWRNLEQLPPGDLASPFYLRLESRTAPAFSRG
jgi:hypothetical protein